MKMKNILILRWHSRPFRAAQSNFASLFSQNLLGLQKIGGGCLSDLEAGISKFRAPKPRATGGLDMGNMRPLRAVPEYAAYLLMRF
ncbi:hypothetical protein ERN12_16970 [Rhodobacteraceae bacterium]|nr:hypothetical protein ERN12_16970 [Paracoccaceae bacterium]